MLITLTRHSAIWQSVAEVWLPWELQATDLVFFPVFEPCLSWNTHLFCFTYLPSGDLYTIIPICNKLMQVSIDNITEHCLLLYKSTRAFSFDIN